MNEEMNRTCYLDMDGVLADFEGGIHELLGINLNDIEEKEMWEQ